jgi:hypothetical protein
MLLRGLHQQLASQFHDLVVQPPPLPRPTNWYSFTRNGIIGDYVIDPTMRIPPSLLPRLERGQTEADRKNLALTATHVNIDAVIWLVGNRLAQLDGVAAPRQRDRKRTSLVIKALQGPVRLKVVRTTSMVFNICDFLTSIILTRSSGGSSRSLSSWM